MNVARIKNRIILSLLKYITKLIPRATPDLLIGEGSALRIAPLIAAGGVTHVLLVTDKDLTSLGLYDNLVNAIQDCGLKVTVFDKVEPNPTEAQIAEGVSVLCANNCDAIIGFGGGSAMDAAKVIAGLGNSNRKVAQMEGLFKVRGDVIPIYMVPTTAGTGSEATVAAVVSNPTEERKYAVIDPRLMPEIAALDPALMRGLPPHITAHTGMDALTHAIEAYTSYIADSKSLRAAKLAVNLIFDNLPTVYENGSDTQAREAMAYASYLAAYSFSQATVGYVHAIAHQLGGIYHVPHGLANAVVLPHIIEFNKQAAQDRLDELAISIGCQGETPATRVEAFISRVKALKDEVGVPETLEVIKSEDVSRIVDAAQKEAIGLYAVPKMLDDANGTRIVRNLMA